MKLPTHHFDHRKKYQREEEKAWSSARTQQPVLLHCFPSSNPYVNEQEKEPKDARRKQYGKYNPNRTQLSISSTLEFLSYTSIALKINTCPNESGSGSFLGNVGLFIISSFYTIKHQNRHQYHLLSRQNLILMETFMNKEINGLE